MKNLLVAYMTPQNEVRGKWVDAPNYDRARSLVRCMDRTNIAYVIDYPICLIDKDIDNPKDKSWRQST